MKIRVARKPANAYQHGNLRDALVQAGLKLLSEGGVASLSLRAAAQLAGVSHAAPYRHFKDKDALVAAIAEEGFRLLVTFLRDEEQKSGAVTVRDRLRAQGRGYVRFALQHPAYLQVIFGGVVPKEGTTPEQQAAGREAYLVLRNVVVEGIARGELQDIDPDVLALANWSIVHGLSQLLISGVVVLPGCDSEQPEQNQQAQQVQQLQIDGVIDTVLRLLGSGIHHPAAP